MISEGAVASLAGVNRSGGAVDGEEVTFLEGTCHRL